MPQTKPDYMLVERGRYDCQRKVPLDLQPTVGVKKWRAPPGKDFDDAYDKLRDPEGDVRERTDSELARYPDGVFTQHFAATGSRALSMETPNTEKLNPPAASSKQPFKRRATTSDREPALPNAACLTIDRVG